MTHYEKYYIEGDTTIHNELLYEVCRSRNAHQQTLDAIQWMDYNRRKGNGNRILRFKLSVRQ